MYKLYLYVRSALAYSRKSPFGFAVLSFCLFPFLSLSLYLSLSLCPNISARHQLNEFSRNPKLKTFIKYVEKLQFFCNRTKTSDSNTKTARFTLLSAMCFSTIQKKSDFWFAVKTAATRKRQKFFDLYIFPAFNNTLQYTLM